jgi:RNA-dependent RNA polymerase
MTFYTHLFLFVPRGSDLFAIIQYSPLLPSTAEDPAEYPAGETFTLRRDSTVDDICDFIVEYINSDVVVRLSLFWILIKCDISFKGLLSDRLLVIAGMSQSDFMYLFVVYDEFYI